MFRAAIVLVVACVFGAWLSVAQGAADKEVPPVQLGSGSLGRGEWTARLEVPEDPQERKRGFLCVGLGLSVPTAARTEGNEVAICSAELPGKRPIVESLTIRVHGKYRVAIAMLFPDEARRIFLKLRGRPGHTYSLKKLPVRETEPVNKVPLTSFAHGYAYRFCIERLTVFDAANNHIGGLGRQPCA